MYNDTVVVGVRDLVRKFESLEGQGQFICIKTRQDYNLGETIRGQEADTSPHKRKRLTKPSPVGMLLPVEICQQNQEQVAANRLCHRVKADQPRQTDLREDRDGEDTGYEAINSTGDG
jgi:hypothetical protein